jgi:hypothetical protein
LHKEQGAAKSLKPKSWCGEPQRAPNTFASSLQELIRPHFRAYVSNLLTAPATALNPKVLQSLEHLVALHPHLGSLENAEGDVGATPVRKALRLRFSDRAQTLAVLHELAHLILDVLEGVVEVLKLDFDVVAADGVGAPGEVVGNGAVGNVGLWTDGDVGRCRC